MSELAPPSALSAALLFFQPVTLISTSDPPLLLVGGRVLFMLTSPEAAARRRIALRALPFASEPVALERPEVRDTRSPPLAAGGGVDLEMPPLEALPLVEASILRSPSLSVFAARRLIAAGPRGALRGALVPTAMVLGGAL